ncbi:FGGY carbohydrate kinase domain-containing protein [Blattella germanica]|nr:FGGY carbohydrate kinase domain-containing protein [Blattella germanica]
MESYFVGVDVGTGSVRAAVVSTSGKLLHVSAKDTKTWSPKAGYFEQSTDDIWQAICHVVKDVTRHVPREAVKGIGFDATCSLAVIDKEGNPLSVSNNEQNVILWLDHRAVEEAEYINSLKHPVLKYVGGKISLEMETPKLLWLKKNLREQCWNKAGYFFDLPDYLTWKATGSDSSGNNGWDEKYFNQIGLSDLMENNWKKIGTVVKEPGSPCGSGISPEAAKELGLVPGTPVGTSIIDAHAGGLGMIGCSAGSVNHEFHTRLGYWLSEGGQSATGKLVDHIIDTHPATAAVKAKIDIHIWPDFHGNRSPLADPSLLGMYGTLHIIDALRSANHSEIESVLICGGLSRNSLFVQTQADVTRLPVLCPKESESVLVGAAILGACAAGAFADIQTAIQEMGGQADIVNPNKEEYRYHEKKYEVFLKMVEHQREYKSIMSSY